MEINLDCQEMIEIFRQLPTHPRDDHFDFSKNLSQGAQISSFNDPHRFPNPEPIVRFILNATGHNQ